MGGRRSHSVCIILQYKNEEKISIIRKADFILTSNFVLKCNYWARQTPLESGRKSRDEHEDNNAVTLFFILLYLYLKRSRPCWSVVELAVQCKENQPTLAVRCTVH